MYSRKMNTPLSTTRSFVLPLVQLLVATLMLRGVSQRLSLPRSAQLYCTHQSPLLRFLTSAFLTPK
ncbi:hypothetical protein FR483_n196R [Paramecium bursaria Chlorella virus FR483]|uniref:Uncharacterized protein n196R n=1 Tax=Paramecium bursaria Chlorella virus FR483 TaxID=399781 RepID=A7J6Q0_PBCVF|nr:hypothetical protein FR483_n196R [Paramecium bursaria Chlorella virus FR483]ABT15481.1 hypothetical protein FR483_n196R [Paramecium bursaria Chlorella virus FR483]